MIPRTLIRWLCVAGVVAVGAPATRASTELFPLSSVRLLDGPFRHAQTVNEAYVLRHDMDRLLAPYRREAGLPPKAPAYPNWESTGLDGHTAGHYLTALAQAVATGGGEEWRRRLDRFVAELAECQQAHRRGYVGPIPGSEQLWAEVGRGELRVEPFSVNGKWVPWYNLHKLYAGLRDAVVLTDHAHAREVLIGLADWAVQLLEPLTDQQVQEMLRAEHGGMNEVLADVAALTGDSRYLRAARRFSHEAILQPLLRREDTLTGLHANTQIPKVIGFARIAELDADPAVAAAWHDAARFFWQTVVTRRSVAFGGNSVREHFHAVDDFQSMLESREGPETCNTYNMLRLSEQLYRRDGDSRYAEYTERALFNHILSSQHPRHGGFVYFTPIRPQHYRVYSQPEQCFWCCVGSGMENHGKYGRFIYAQRPDTIVVNQFIASEVEWTERQVVLRQETRFPEEAETRLVVQTGRPARWRMEIRQPQWVDPADWQVQVNGQPVAPQPAGPGYVAVEREWRAGDEVRVALPMRTRLEALPDDSGYVAVMHGPLLLAAPTEQTDLEGLMAGDGRMAHIAPGAYRPLETAPMLVGEPGRLVAGIRPVAGESLTFAAPDLIRPAGHRHLRLIPFYRVHDSRYMMYWRAVAPAEYGQVTAELARAEAARLALEERTVDAVTPGEQQPEVEHRYVGEDSATGVTLGRRWRDAGGWFEYHLQTHGEADLALQVTYAGWERGRRFRIEVNGQPVATVARAGEQPDRFVEETYPLDPAIVAMAPSGQLRVRFVAEPGARTASLYHLRLLRD